MRSRQPVDAYNIVVAGHSFAKRAIEDLKEHISPHKKCREVTIFGESGLTIEVN